MERHIHDRCSYADEHEHSAFSFFLLARVLYTYPEEMSQNSILKSQRQFGVSDKLRIHLSALSAAVHVHTYAFREIVSRRRGDMPCFNKSKTRTVLLFRSYLISTPNSTCYHRSVNISFRTINNLTCIRRERKSSNCTSSQSNCRFPGSS
jgi:hypothetical protein